MIIFWLASMGANAALRGSFVYDVQADCVDDGSTVNANHCITYRRRNADSHLVRRFAVAGKTGLGVMSGIAGLSALIM